MNKLIKDAAAILGFPWGKPAEPSSRSTTSSGFVEKITTADLKEMYQRNQAAHAVVSDVAADAIVPFTCTDPKGEELESFNAEVQVIFHKFIQKSLQQSLKFTRRDGNCGILIGYADNDVIKNEVTGTPKVTYLQPIPVSWTEEIVPKKDKDGNLVLPLQLDHYDISIGASKQEIHGSRLVHLRNPSLEEESMEGESSLICIYDDLTVLKSMTWGTGQAMWRHGGGLTVFIAPEGSEDEQAQIDAISDVATDINAMTVLTMPAGTEVVTGTPGALNPKEYFDTCVQMISIGSRIPVSILRGSVSGALTASEKDRKDYYELLDNIQKEILTPALMDILKRFQASGQLPEQEFLIEWERTPIWEKEEQQSKLLVAQTELTEAKTKATLAMVGTPAEDV
jgi:hypothetical protein